jgi:DNA-binding CsgD family transcriptional regulator
VGARSPLGAGFRPDDLAGCEAGCIVGRNAMPWLADLDLGAARAFVRGIAEARTVVDVRGQALLGLAEVVPADVLTWDRVTLATGAVRHETVPAEAEPSGVFPALVQTVAGHPLLRAHAAGRRAALRLSETDERHRLPHSELYGELLHPSGVEYAIAIGVRTGRGEVLVAGLGRSEREFSERDRDLLDLVCPGLSVAVRAAEARARLVRAMAANPPSGTAVVLLNDSGEIERSSLDGERWLAEHFGAAEHPGWLPRPLADWLALPPRPPLVSARDGRCLTVSLLPGDPNALLLEEEVQAFRPEALRRLGLTRRESEMLGTAAAIEDEREIAIALFLSRHAVHEQLEHIEAKLDVPTPAAAVARALRESA